MLIGIWGHSAIGKTYWLQSVANDLVALNRNLVLVYADVQEERRPYGDGKWLSVRRSRWKGEKSERLEILPTMIQDSKVWVLESMRWFIGMQPDICQEFKANGNRGVHMILLHSKPEVQRDFRYQRCMALGKPWNKYWDGLQALKTESYRSYNSIKHHWQAAGVPYTVIEISPNREEFALVTAKIKELICVT